MNMIGGVGLPSFPTELLRNVLLHVHPNDLVALASANRHLRDAVQRCIDHALAKRQVREVEHSHKHPKRIHYDHPLLFQHAVTKLAVRDVSKRVAEDMWGSDWIPNGAMDAKKEHIRLNRWFLFASAECGFSEGLQLLTPFHPVLGEVDKNGITLLGLTISSLPEFAMQLLLEYGAPVTPAPPHEEEKSALFFALENGNLPILQLLLQRGANPNATNYHDPAIGSQTG
ncbi:hypothetical protein HDU96_007391 [Phlyctochytrium bullatum]|nr:hypothetical protein HDU96_007391 [Phlyctochytrium bullatum]